ncbi:uncharacterized protein B0P05DRAFT_620332 [Gilbertella persicaria]|uniref:uncharacterized protein n=1 Tax=Gilbertella persicaria TaxID=101096 RepID=UPI00221FD608|nr:uncharacterized protein B0P05DRAFT_620332 [Gilbertella persicaria]KAI8069137.1 hypothetical protein B0P05DRAFT_620332 [Gilbertella persicaria]
MYVIAFLRAGKIWMENSERNIRYLRHIVRDRSTERQFNMIAHPVTNMEYTSTKDKLEAVQAFYQELVLGRVNTASTTELSHIEYFHKDKQLSLKRYLFYYPS